MGSAADLLPAFAAGLALGAVFFGGLWWTVRRLAVAPRPSRLLWQSFALRFAIALAGFYAAANGRGGALAVAVLGFLVMRELIARRFFTRADASGGMPWKS